MTNKIEEFMINEIHAFELTHPAYNVSGLVYAISFKLNEWASIQTDFYIYGENHYLFTNEHPNGFEIATGVVVIEKELRKLESQIYELIGGTK